MASHGKSISIQDDLFAVLTAYADYYNISKKQAVSDMFQTAVGANNQFCYWFNNLYLKS